MRYLLLICVDPTITPDEAPGDIQEWFDEIDRHGSRLMGDQLEPPTNGRSVRVRDGAIVTTDGPFAETKEFIAGFDVIDAPDLETAVAIAAKHPVAKFGAVEVRQFWKG